MKEKHNFTKGEIEQIIKKTKLETPEEALTEWAYYTYDLKHNGSKTLGRVGKTFIEVIDLP